MQFMHVHGLKPHDSDDINEAKRTVQQMAANDRQG